MMFKKLNEAIEVHKIKEEEITLEEREIIENELIFGNIIESLEAGQDTAAMYGGLFKNAKDNTIPDNKKAREVLDAENKAKKDATNTKKVENKNDVEQLKLNIDNKGGETSESR